LGRFRGIGMKAELGMRNEELGIPALPPAVDSCGWVQIRNPKCDALGGRSSPGEKLSGSSGRFSVSRGDGGSDTPRPRPRPRPIARCHPGTDTDADSGAVASGIWDPASSIQHLSHRARRRRRARRRNLLCQDKPGWTKRLTLRRTAPREQSTNLFGRHIAVDHLQEPFEVFDRHRPVGKVRDLFER